jgi:tripartite-type tricarboxylate transporter receptor subunit TctC
MHSLKKLAIASLFLVASTAGAQSWPTKPLTWIIPFAPGGATDVIARDIANKVSRQLNQQIIIVNIGGAGGTIGAAKVAREPADGYTYLVGHMGYMAAAPSLYKKLPYDPVKDFETVFRFPDTPLVLLVRAESPYKSASDLIDAARKNPGKLNMANAGVGSTSHLVAALFANKAGVRFTDVPYRGIAPAIIDLAGGAVDAVFDQSNTALTHIAGGRLRAIAVTSAMPMPQFPGVQPLADEFPGFEAATWYGLYAPKGTPKQFLDILYQAYAKALTNKDWRKAMSDKGMHLLQPKEYTPDAFAAFTAAEITKWHKVIVDANIHID